MNNPTAIIIDDEKHALESLQALLKLYCSEIKILATANNIKEGKGAIQQLNPDIVFLDIAIGNDNGFDLVEALNPIKFQLIFTTAFSEFALKAFQVNAIDYLLKPIDPALLQLAVEKARKAGNSFQVQEQLQHLFQSFNSNKVDKIAISTMEGLVFIKVAKIAQVKGSGNYSTFHLLDNRQIMASKSLKHFEEILPKDIFFRSHQSHLINLQHVSSIQSADGIIELVNKMQVPLSRARKEPLLSAMNRNFDLGA